MSNNTNIPNFNDICGTVTQSLAETIINRNNIIAELRDELAKTREILHERCANYAELSKTNAELRKQIEGWRDEVEALEKDEKELYCTRNALVVAENLLRNVNAQCEVLRSENEYLKQDFGRGDAYWLAVTERDDARRRYCDLIHSLDGTKPEEIAKSNGWNDLYDSDNTPSLFEQKSDTDPATGVQYGDLPY